MSGIPPSPRFFQTPFRYLKWASIQKPAYFYSIIVGLTGPVLVLTVPPIRRYMGEEQIAKIPMTYPSKSCRTHGGNGLQAVRQWGCEGYALMIGSSEGCEAEADGV